MIGNRTTFDICINKNKHERLGIYIQYKTQYVSKIVEKDTESSDSLYVGDLITKVNGKKMNTKRMAKTIFESYPCVTLTVVRNEFYSSLLN